MTLIFDLLTLKVVSESRVTWATSVSLLVFLGLSVLDLGLMYATDRQRDARQHHRLMPPHIRGGGIKTRMTALTDGGKSLTICSTVSKQYQHWRDRRTDMDRNTIP